MIALYVFAFIGAMSVGATLMVLFLLITDSWRERRRNRSNCTWENVLHEEVREYLESHS